MAIVRWSTPISGMAGKSGNVVYKKRGNTFYISHRPDFSKRKLSAAQKESLRNFRAAVGYARGILADPIARKPFDRKAKQKHRTAYNFIIAEYMSR